MSNSPDSHVQFPCGAQMKNRFMLAPLTNTQSHADGRLSDTEFNWLKTRAEGGFGLVMTCATSIQEIGRGFPGQLGIHSDDHIPGHKKLTKAIKAQGALAVVQLHHAGMRSPAELIGTQPVCPSDSEKHSARALTLDEVYQLRGDFISAAIRAKQSGYDGVEVHGAHGYILTQFLSNKINKRTDAYGGSLENRSHLLFEVIDGIRSACGADFLLGVRLSPERFGMDLGEVKSICEQLITDGHIDFLDLSLWDVFKLPEDKQYKDKDLLTHFTELEYGDVKLTVAGKISTAIDVQRVLDCGVDFVTIGRSAILHHDFPKQVIANPGFKPVDLPVTRAYLNQQGLGEAFINYMGRWPGFVE